MSLDLITDEPTIEGLIPAAPVDAGTVGLYSQGACHVLAIAMSRLWGSGEGFLVVRDPWEVVWEDEADPDNAVHAVVHVYALVPTGQGVMAMDVFGMRPSAEIETEIPARFAAGIVDVEFYAGEDALGLLIEREEGDGAPLARVEEAGIARAMMVAGRLFPDGPCRELPAPG